MPLLFTLDIISRSLAAICAVLLGVTFTKGQRSRYPIIRKLDGKQFPLLVAVLVFTCCSIILSVLDKTAESQTSRQIQAHAFEKLSSKNHGFLNLLSGMIAAGSDGWLPQTKQEFFSRRSVDSICHQLNADAKAPVIPERSWRIWFGERTEGYRQALATILAEQGPQLDASTVRAISEVERSTLLTFPPQWMRAHRIDLQKGWQRPPLLCFGLEDLFEESFRELAVLQQEVERGEQRHGLLKSEDWRAFPFPKNDSSVGRSRFGPDDLSRWMVAHPHAPAGDR